MAGGQHTRLRRRRSYTRGQRAKWNGAVLAKAREARAAYRAGSYVAGSYHREATCNGCGRLFPMWRSGEQMQFCSRECAFKARVATPERKAASRERDRARSAKRNSFRALLRTTIMVCEHCREPFRTARSRRYCSHACSHAASLRTPLVGKRRCKRCGAEFIARLTGGRTGNGQLFCSESCNDRFHAAGQNHRQRARHYGVRYEPIKALEVLDRDGWHCQICGRATPKRLRGTTDSRAPELDHRVPLAVGGGHTWENVQCACRRCNIAKGGTLTLGQMQLFARATH